MMKAADKAESLRADMKKLEDTKIPTDEYKKLEKELSSAEKEMKKLLSDDSKILESSQKIDNLTKAADGYVSKMRELENTQIPTKEYIKLQSQLDKTTQRFEELNDTVETFRKIGMDTKSIPFRQVQDEAQELYMEIEDIRGAIFQLEEAGKAFTLGSDTSKYEVLVSKYQAANTEIEKQKNLQNEIVQKQTEAIKNATALQKEMTDLVNTGKAFTLGSDTDAYTKKTNQLKYTENSLATLAQQHEVLETQQKNISTGYKKWGDIVKKSFNGVHNVLKKANDAVKSFGTWVKNIANRHMPSLRKQTEKTSGTMSRFGRRLRSLLSGIFIFNVISSGFRSMFAAIKEGYENLYKGNKKFENSVDNLKASALTLKNALAAAFSPLVQIAIPYIQKVIEWMTKLANSVGQFIAAITGQKTYLRAVKQTTAAIKDQTKAENKQLSSLDKLNNLTSSKDSSSDDVGGAGSFEEVPISDKWKNMADWLKDMWKDSDFYDLGRFLGEKLKKALDSIPWSKIKKSLRKIAKSIATFLNGFLETPGLFRSIGKTIAECINSAFEFVDEFVWDFHWKSLGQAIVDTVQGIVDTLDWNVISSAITGLAYGLAALFNTIFGATETWGDVGMTIAKAINTVIHGLFLFVHNFDFAAFGTAIGTMLNDALTNIAYWKLGNILANGINGAFAAVYNFCETFDWIKLATKVADGINKAFGNLDWEQIKGAIESLSTHLGEWINAFIEKIDWEKVGSTIGNIIQRALDFVYTLKDTIDWAKVKEAITETLKSAISEIDVGELAALFLGLLSASFALKATTSVFKDAGKQILTSLASAIISSASSFATAIKGLVPVIASALKTVLTTDMAAIFSTETATTIAAYIGTTLVAAFVAWMAGNWTGKQLGALLFPDMEDEYKNFSWFGEGGFFDQLFGGVDFSKVDEIKQCFTDLKNAWVDMHTDFENNPVVSIIMGLIDPIGLVYSSISNLKDNAQETFDTISNALQTCLDGWKQFFDDLGANLATWWSETWLSDALWNFGQWWEEKVAPWFTPEKWAELWNNIKQSAVEKWAEIKQTIGDKITEIHNKIVDKLNTIKTKWTNTWGSFKSIVADALNGAKSVVQPIISWIEDKILSLKNTIDGLKQKATGIFSGGSNKKTSRTATYAYTPAAAAVANLDIPGYATGQVIPKTMKKHLAYLGDNNQETEVVSPLSTIQQALREEMASGGFGGGDITVRVPVEIDGNVLMEIVKKLSREEVKRTGRPVFG